MSLADGTDGQVMDFCEHGNEPLTSVKLGGFSDKMKNCKLFKKYPTPYRWLQFCLCASNTTDTPGILSFQSTVP